VVIPARAQYHKIELAEIGSRSPFDNVRLNTGSRQMRQQELFALRGLR